MKLGWLECALLFALPLATGAGLLRAIGLGARFDRLAWPAWAWIAGSLANALLLYAWLQAGLPLARAGWALGALALAALALGARARRRSEEELAEQAAAAARFGGALFALCVALALALTLARIAFANLQPVMQGDEANYWTLRAKLLWQHQSIDAGFLADSSDTELIYHPAYPFLNALMQLPAFVLAGDYVQVESRLALQPCALALVLALAAALRRVCRPALAGLLVLLLACLPITSAGTRSADADVMNALGLVVAFDGWSRARAGRAHGARVLALGCAFLLWSKNDGLLWCLCALAGACLSALLPAGGGLAALRPRRAWLWLALPLGLLALTELYNRSHGFVNDLASGDYRGKGLGALVFEQFGQRWQPVLTWFGTQVFLAAAQSAWIPLLWLLALVLAPGWLARPQTRALHFALLAAWLGLLLVYVGTPHELHWHLETSARRVAWQLYPPCAILLGLELERLLPARASAARHSAALQPS